VKIREMAASHRAHARMGVCQALCRQLKTPAGRPSAKIFERPRLRRVRYFGAPQFKSEQPSPALKMSAPEADRLANSKQKTKSAESLATPKKRKHDTTEREPSKKKKKPRIEDNAPAEFIASEPTAHTIEKSKKKKKARENKEKAAQLEEGAEPQDVEFTDARIAESRQDEAEGNPVQVLEETENDSHSLDIEGEDELKLLESAEPTSFYSTRLSLYLSIPAISLEHGTSAILTTHLAPFLLVYFPPAQGILLAFSDPVLAAKPNTGINLAPLPPRTADLTAQEEVLAITADEFGACNVWLTVTCLVFRPERGDTLHGWTNVTSEGFVGLVSYNYFQAAVGGPRIPHDWKWSGAVTEQTHRKRGRKGRLRGESDVVGAQEVDAGQTDEALVEERPSKFLIDDGGGHFVHSDGTKVKSTQEFRVVDTEIVPAHERNKWALQINATLLDESAEKLVLEEERLKFEHAQTRTKSPGPRSAEMSGALSRSISREGSVASRMSGQTPARHHRTRY
jgi:DNA-directed RNA polymerase I subunit RPA43